MVAIWLAFLMDALAGDPYWFPHPVRLIGGYIAYWDRWVQNRRLGPTGLRVAGIFLTVTTVVGAAVTVWGILALCRQVHPGLEMAVNSLFLWTCLSPRCLQQEAAKIAGLLRRGELESARRQLSYIVGRDTMALDESGIVRAVVETVAENTSDGVIAPLCYMFIGGAPLAMAYKAINTLDSMVGYRKGHYCDFGWSSARTDDLANFIPARLSAGVLWLAAVVLALDWRNCARVIRRDRRNHASPNSAYPEAAVAGALGVQLGGTNSYFGQPLEKPTIGTAGVLLNREHIGAANRMMYTASLLALAILSAGSWLMQGFR